MTYRSNRSYRSNKTYMTDKKLGFGGYRNLRSYQQAEIIYDYTCEFCEKYMTYKTNKSYRTYDQMVQAARSGKQNIVEGSQASRTSKKTELKLLGVARASLEELLVDYEDFLRRRNLLLWSKDSPKAREIRALAYRSDRSYRTYMRFLAEPETAANVAICLIKQANYLLDRQIASLEKEFVEKGGYTESLFRKRLEYRREK